MAPLSSCYFCGTALDDSLASYAVTGDGPGATQSVVLCRGCRRKVVPLLEAALGAVEPGDPPDAPAVADAQADTLLVAEAGESDSPQDPQRPGQSSSAPETTDASATDTSRQRATDDGAVSSLDTDETAGSAPPEEPPSPAGVEPVGDEDDRDEHEGDEVPVDEAPATAGTDEREESDDGGEQSESGTTTTISALEYNKVMRLLQNREFPVERAELETVATSAYDLARPEVAEVIDLAIDRDLLVEADGELSRPD